MTLLDGKATSIAIQEELKIAVARADEQRWKPATSRGNYCWGQSR